MERANASRLRPLILPCRPRNHDFRLHWLCAGAINRHDRRAGRSFGRRRRQRQPAGSAAGDAIPKRQRQQPVLLRHPRGWQAAPRSLRCDRSQRRARRLESPDEQLHAGDGVEHVERGCASIAFGWNLLARLYAKQQQSEFRQAKQFGRMLLPTLFLQQRFSRYIPDVPRQLHAYHLVVLRYPNTKRSFYQWRVWIFERRLFHECAVCKSMHHRRGIGSIGERAVELELRWEQRRLDRAMFSVSCFFSSERFLRHGEWCGDE